MVEGKQFRINLNVELYYNLIMNLNIVLFLFGYLNIWAL